MTLTQRVKKLIKDGILPEIFTVEDLRNCKKYDITENDIDRISNYDVKSETSTNIPFLKSTQLDNELKQYSLMEDI